MSDSLDIHDILKTGFFTTSRARHAYSSSEDSTLRTSNPLTTPTSSTVSRYAPRSFDERPYRRGSYPPPPIVEDEVDSLSKEYGACVLPIFDEEPQSKGEIDQQPVIIEVHEHNPERRFVFVPGSTNPTPKPSECGSPEDSASESKPRHKTTPAAPQPEAKVERKQDLQSAAHLSPSDAVPTLGRRRSRQDLPRLDTDAAEDRVPTHHRSQSAASGIRPEFSRQQQQQKPPADDYLSPEITKHGPAGRERSYHSYGRTSTNGRRSPTQSSVSLGEVDDRRWDDKYNRRTATAEGRATGNFESNNLKRPISGDRVNGPRPLDGNRHARTDLRDQPPLPHRPAASADAIRMPSPSKHQKQPSPREDGFKTSYRRDNPVVIEDSRDSMRPFRRDDDRSSRSPSRTATMPIPSAELPDERSFNPRTSSTFPIEQEVKVQEKRGSQLPYPEDDETHGAWIGLRADPLVPQQTQSARTSLTSMPLIPPIDDTLAAQNSSTGRMPSPAAPAASQYWNPPAFDPEKSVATRPDMSVGSYRRYSESKDGSGNQGLPAIPECTRSEPVAGKMDWLTLPRTDFNICPSCYDGTFADTKYRTQFQPVLRPSGHPIACDFGSSPWYRIAWLLTLRYKIPDLQLFYHIANIASSSRDYACPSSRTVLRNWYTIRDPYTKRPVPEFTVCYQCAKTIETLLPNLAGVFLPLDSRNEPTRSICALHFTPDRKQFVLFFDAFETTSDKAYSINRKPDVGDLSMLLTRLSTLNECREDRRVSEGYWYVMDFLPDFTVCGQCFQEVVEPQQADNNIIAQNFHTKPRKLPIATCQLYSPRMRDVFKRACRKNDHEYLQGKVLERLNVEKDIHSKFIDLVRDGRNDMWTDEQIEKLSREWKRWE